MMLYIVSVETVLNSPFRYFVILLAEKVLQAEFSYIFICVQFLITLLSENPAEPAIK